MKKIGAFPAILEPAKKGYGISFPDLPGAVSMGDDYEDAVKMAKECLSLHLYGMSRDEEKIPKPSSVKKIMKSAEPGELVALIEPDVFAVKISMESEKSVHVDITIPKNLLKTADSRAKTLGLNRSKFFQTALKEVL
ncbi:MAG: type II toxin-antitoxin system HicB family antitoxin [Nitrospinae bacterium]|nr:type II toxin-antitoxin system HicB family antitoxin [Nitrospinota bacterium]MBL7021243.1 type II toxin-antitoxin system HicB family antitoxin [Nitrospinaceae bacterium]